MLEACAWHSSPRDPATLSQSTGALLSALRDLPCRAARTLSTCTCSLQRQLSVPGDPWLLDSVPKDCLVQMPWDVSSSFPWLISGPSSHIASCPLHTSLTTLFLLSSSHDPSLSHFLASVAPSYSSAWPSLHIFPRCWCSWGKGGIQLGSAGSKEVGHDSHRAEVNAECSVVMA